MNLKTLKEEKPGKRWDDLTSYVEAVQYLETRMGWLNLNHSKLFGGRLSQTQKEHLETAVYHLQQSAKATEKSFYSGCHRASLHLDLEACKKEWDRRACFSSRTGSFDKDMKPLLTDPYNLLCFVEEEGVFSDEIDAEAFFDWCERQVIG